MRKPFRILNGLLLIVIAIGIAPSVSARFYDNSYALVIGINEYASSNWGELNYAVNDAQSIASFLTKQGFLVTTLYNDEAIGLAILRQFNHIARQLKGEDRVLIFFAGHGYTETFGDQDFGYIVPYDGNDTSTYISVDQLREFSRKMRAAKHQLFIMDACYAGLMVDTRAGAVDNGIFDYLTEITRRPARQVLMAGGKGQQVVDNGQGGHSVFTGYLLKALEGKEADLNRDGYITFPELTAYLLPAASNNFQTPAGGHLYEHQLGEFVFIVGDTNTPHRNVAIPVSDSEGIALRGELGHDTELLVPETTPTLSITPRTLYANEPPRFITGTITPQPALVGDHIIVDTYWEDVNGDFIVEASIRYCKQGTYSCETVILNWIPEDVGKNKARAAKTIKINEPGIYEYQFWAADERPLHNRIHSVDELFWQGGGILEVLLAPPDE